MNRVKMAGAGLLLAVMPFLAACPGGDDPGNQDEMAVVVGALGLLALGQIQIGGNWSYYNGPSSYPGGCGGFCSSGTTKVGTYSFTNTHMTNACTNTTDCGTPLPAITNATIVEYDNAKQVLYAQYDSSHAFTPNKFTYIKWAQVGGKTYLCPDISGVGTQDTLAKAKDSNANSTEDYLETTNSSDLTLGCGSGLIFWSRLEAP